MKRDLISGFALGLLVGLLIGLSIAQVTGVILGALTSLLAAFFGLRPDKEGETAHVQKNHAQDVQDECPAICSCSCCGVQLVLQPSVVASSTVISIISSEKSMEYVLKDTLDFPYKIWQPPQNIN